MATQVRETAAGKSISAYAVLNKKGEHVATVNAHFANSGRVTVDVWNLGGAADRCLAAAAKCGAVTPAQLDNAEAASRAKRDWCQPEEHARFAAYDLFGMQQGSAGGYGYDKFTAALSRLWIDGHQLADNSGRGPATERLLAQYKRACAKHQVRTPTEGQGVAVAYAFPEGFDKAWREKAAKMGAHFANYQGGRWTSLYLEAGLKRLETLGYRVIQAI